MVLGNSHPSSKREMWDHMAREFDYTCPSCWRRPDFEDCESFLVTGFCRTCRPEKVESAGSDNPAQML